MGDRGEPAAVQISTGNLVVQCPTCKRPVPWQEDQPHRPFCSARCKQIDFGDWVLEKHAIAGAPLDDWQADENE